MVINENNSQINSFGKGMNSDVSYDQVDNQSYVYGKNVRITNNTTIGKQDFSTDSYFYSQEGAISPVLSGDLIDNINLGDSWETLAVKSINNICVIVAKQTNTLSVFKFTITDDVVEYPKRANGEIAPWWNVDISEKAEDFKNLKLVSCVLYQELEGVIKLYIATGIYPIILLRVDDNVDYQGNNDYYHDVDNYINNRILPRYPVYIQNIVDGSLKTGLVLYTYRYYNKFENTTLLAPLTNKIQVIDSNRNVEIGNAADTITSIGFTLKINHTDDYAYYKRILIFRVHYIKPGEDATVELIYDGEVNSSTSFLFNDVGGTPLRTLTIEEFAAMSGLTVIPKVIEQNQQYMFASNIKDDTILQNVEAVDGNISPYKGISVMLSTLNNGAPTLSTQKYKDFSEPASLYLADRNINADLVTWSYNNIFTSSLLRSLRRGEEYRYGIVYYDKYGRRTNVLPITNNKGIVDVKMDISSTVDMDSFVYNNGNIVTNPVGVSIYLPQPKINGKLAKDIIGCQIVRRSSRSIYLKTLLQVAVARPVAQNLYPTSYNADNEYNATKDSPLMPTGFLFTGPVVMRHGYYNTKGAESHAAYRNNGIYLIFSNEIDFARNDVLSRLNAAEIKILPVFEYGIAGYNSYYDASLAHINRPTSVERTGVYVLLEGEYIAINGRSYQPPSTKSTDYMLFPLYSIAKKSIVSNDSFAIKSVKDVKMAEWFDGFSNLQLDGDRIRSGGIKKYQQFQTNIGIATYNNWVSGASYDQKISHEDGQPNVDEDASVFLDVTMENAWNATKRLGSGEWASGDYATHYNSLSYIGPGPSCFLIALDNLQVGLISIGNQKTVACNITHNINNVDSEPDEFVQYFGFGNYFNLELNDAGDAYEVVHNTIKNNLYMVVYDGDCYVTPHEIVTMFKAYDFTSSDTLQSMLIVNYIPLESKVNTFFNYGMNYLNTSSANLLFEPGSIDGVSSQERPLHLYNLIYSANDESNDVFTLVVEKSEDNNFKQRTYYSELKTNGEYVDNFTIFKPAQFIDVDSKYGEVTNLLTDMNNLYYWQDTAFGKFSVNERSLVNDQNGNTIMLGQAGILSRYDYISTRYGMRPYDFCAIGAEGGIYWIDVNNSAVVASKQGSCGNLGEQLNVLNIINRNISTEVPRINYDLQNNELLCSCLVSSVSSKTNLDLFVFNLKLGVATSVYTRDYSHILNVKNTLYGIKFFNQINQLSLTKYNNLNIDDVNTSDKYLKPMYFSIVTNASASTTKVFDSQQIIPVQRDPYVESDELASLLENRGFRCRFHTDLNEVTLKTFYKYANTDREGNIIYNVPRYGNEDYGNRLRGKWMKTDFSVTLPDETVSISHIITKFRQSYS